MQNFVVNCRLILLTVHRNSLSVKILVIKRKDLLIFERHLKGNRLRKKVN